MVIETTPEEKRLIRLLNIYTKEQKILAGEDGQHYADLKNEFGFFRSDIKEFKTDIGHKLDKISDNMVEMKVDAAVVKQKVINLENKKSAIESIVENFSQYKLMLLAFIITAGTLISVGADGATKIYHKIINILK